MHSLSIIFTHFLKINLKIFNLINFLNIVILYIKNLLYFVEYVILLTGDAMNKYSIIVPVYNEELAVPIFYDAVTKELDKLNEDYEVIFVNDGSKDKTVEIIKGLAEKDNRVKLLSFSRNFGQQAAIFCGFEHATGDAVVCMDVDLQDPVEVVTQMIEKWKEGYEVVHGERLARKGESFFKKITSSIYLKFIKSISGLYIPKNVGEFKLFDRKVIEVFNSMPEQERYLRGITAWAGFKQTSVKFERPARAAGETKYSVKKLFKLAGKSIVTLSTFPLSLAMIFGLIGSFLSMACFTTFIVLSCCKIFLPLTAWLFPTIAMLFSLSFILNGFSNIYLRRTYQEAQARPRYLVAEKINIEK